MPVEVLPEVQLPGALGDRGHPGGDRVGDVEAQSRVAAQVRGVHLGEAATDVQPGYPGGQADVGERVDLHHLASGRLKQLGRLGIAERERSPAEHGDPRATRDGRHLVGGIPRLDRQRGGAAGQRLHGVQIHVGAHMPGQRGDGVGRFEALGRGHQSQVAGRRRDLRIPGQDAEDGHPGIGEHLGELGPVRRRGDPVHDDASHLHVRIERRQAERRGGGGA